MKTVRNRRPGRLAAAFAVGTALVIGLSACSSDDKDGKDDKKGADNAAAQPPGSPAAPTQLQPPPAATRIQPPPAASLPSTLAPAGATATRPDAASPGGKSTAPAPKPAASTLSGAIQFLAPGKFVVMDEQRGDTSFFIATDTRILSAGALCGESGTATTADAQGQGTKPCDADKMAQAVKDSVQSAIIVKVAVDGNGTATSVVETVPTNR